MKEEKGKTDSSLEFGFFMKKNRVIVWENFGKVIHSSFLKIKVSNTNYKFLPKMVSKFLEVMNGWKVILEWMHFDFFQINSGIKIYFSIYQTNFQKVVLPTFLKSLLSL